MTRPSSNKASKSQAINAGRGDMSASPSISTQPLLDKISAHMDDLLSVVDEGAPGVLDKKAKDIAALLKLVEIIEARNSAQEQKLRALKYTRYEDAPPPSPEEEEAFLKRLESLYNRFDAESDTVRPTEGTDG